MGPRQLLHLPLLGPGRLTSQHLTLPSDASPGLGPWRCGWGAPPPPAGVGGGLHPPVSVAGGDGSSRRGVGGTLRCGLGAHSCGGWLGVAVRHGRGSRFAVGRSCPWLWVLVPHVVPCGHRSLLPAAEVSWAPRKWVKAPRDCSSRFPWPRVGATRGRGGPWGHLPWAPQVKKMGSTVAGRCPPRTREVGPMVSPVAVGGGSPPRGRVRAGG